jgi:glycosyltransferase involved in cell wall biosynthesis
VRILGTAPDEARTMVSKSPKPVSVVVPTFNRAEFLQSALAQLAAMTRTVPFEVIVVDDGSEDQTKEVVGESRDLLPALHYLRQENAGAGAARNAGVRRASGDLIVFVDDDMWVEPDHLERHAEARALFGDCLVNGHWEFSPQSVELLSATPFGRFRLEIERWYRETSNRYEPLGDNRFRPDSVISGNLSIRRGLFDELGGFDESIGHAGLEDQEFSQRAARAGCTFVCDRNIRIWANEALVALQPFMDRRFRGAYDTVWAARVSPEPFKRNPMITANSPITGADGFRVRMLKRARGLRATRAGARALRALITLMERLVPNSRLLRKLYWSLGGVYVFRGVRMGLEDVARNRRSHWK